MGVAGAANRSWTKEARARVRPAPKHARRRSRRKTEPGATNANAGRVRPAFCKLRSVSGPLASLASSQPVRAPRYLATLAGGIPLAYYVACASAYGGLHEEGSFIAAARSLGIAHPPGAPLTSLTSAFFALIPVGSLSLRVAVASSVFAAVTLGMFARALFFSLLGVGVRSHRLSALIALAASWFVAQTPLFFEQATRPNVFTLQFAMALVIIDALTRFELSEPTDDRRTLYFAAFVQGLSFANHHVFALLMLSVAAPTLGRVFARRGFLGLMGHVAAPILGFSAYAYVPIRGGRFPDISIGNPSNLTRSLWVLSAEPWWGPPDLPEPNTLARLREGFCETSPLVAVLVLTLAVVGFAWSARAESQRRFSALWLIALLVPLASISWILEPKLLRDTWGALIPCALSLVALASFALGLGLQWLGQRTPRLGSRGSSVLAIAALVLVVLAAEQRGHARFDAPDALDDLTRRDLPKLSVVLASDASTWFRHIGGEVEEQLRGDVTVVPMPFLDYPRTRTMLSEGLPELVPLIGGTQAADKLGVRELRALAEQRPLLIEADRHVAPALYPSLVGDGLFARVLPHTAALERGFTQPRQAARFDTFYARIGAQARMPELSGRLARAHFHLGLMAATLNDRAAAGMHVRLGLRAAPSEPRLLRLSATLASNAPLDPAPFLREEALEADR